MSRTDRIQQRLGLEFTSPGLLVEALTHPSYLNENPDSPTNSYQRLEFLGDAILGSITAEELFRRYPDLSEGELTRFRSHLVQEKSLARIASELELGEYLHVGRGEEASGGRHRNSNLAAALEALIGAVYLDQGADVAKSLVLNLLGDEIARAEESGGAPLDPKSHLQEMVQAQTWPSSLLSGWSTPKVLTTNADLRWRFGWRIGLPALALRNESWMPNERRQVGP